MYNLYDIVKESLLYKKFTLNELICVEYTCPVEDEHVGIYSKYDYLIHIISGRKTWRTTQGTWIMEPGETLYVKKGAAIVTQDFEESFCMLGFFLPDDLIRESIIDLIHDVPGIDTHQFNQFTASKLEYKPYLHGFVQSMLPYFRDEVDPPEAILMLKLKELIIHVLYNCDDAGLKSYLGSLAVDALPSLTHIMETNYCFNMKLEEFARLSHRSLSKFKSDFSNYYHTTPGRWLLNKRLELASNLLLNNHENISEVAFECGFEDVSHFSRVFKNKFGMAPSSFLKSLKN